MLSILESYSHHVKEGSFHVSSYSPLRSCHWFPGKRSWENCSEVHEALKNPKPLPEIFYIILYGVQGSLRTHGIRLPVISDSNWLKSLKGVRFVISTLNKLPVHRRATDRKPTTHAHTHSYGQSEISLSWTFMFLDCGRKLRENPC